MTKFSALLHAVLAAIVFIYVAPFATAQEYPDILGGETSGQGTSFEIKDSQYLNISLESSQQLTVSIESIPGLISLKIGSSSEAASADLTIGGLEPDKTYYKFQDSHKSGAVFISDENGRYAWNQDLAAPHHIWFMERKGTIYIESDTKLTEDLNETVEIYADNVTLDCDNHKIQGPGSGYGIYVNNKTNVTIKNCRVSNFSYGAHLIRNFLGSLISGSEFFENQIGIKLSWLLEDNQGFLSPNFNISRNKVYANGYGIFSGNCTEGIFSDNEIFDNSTGLLLQGCSTILRRNSLANNRYNFGVESGYNNLGLDQDIDTSNIINGKPIYFLVNEENITIDASSNAGYVGVVNSKNILIKDIEISNNIQGILFDSNFDSKIDNVRVSNNWNGIQLSRCLRCDVYNSYASSNNTGIYIWFSSFGIIENNNLINNQAGLVYLVGLYGQDAHSNKAFHNNFISNTIQIAPGGYYNNNLFDDGYPSGGNYYSDYTGVDLMSGPLQNEPGADGIGDTLYTFSNRQDRYPLIKEFGVTEPQGWSFAIISDLHVGQALLDYGNSTWNDGNSGDNNISSVHNLKNTVERINSNIQKYNLKFVTVNGDFSDSGELSELNKAKEILSFLQIPWIPIPGNHDIWPYYGAQWELIGRTDKMAPELTDSNGTDKYFYDIFLDQYQKLSEILPNWEKQAAPIWNSFTDPERNSYLENFTFDFNGYQFIGLDFNDREIESWPAKGAAAAGNLNNFDNGTWRWFLDNLEEYKINYPNESEKVILLSHHPLRKEYLKSFYDFKLYNIGFSEKELTTIYEALVPYRDEVYGLFAGHTHKNIANSFGGDTLKLIETDANVKSPLARLVQFYPDGRIDYSKMLGNDMNITAHSPVDLEVIDPDGLVVNKQINQIPGANYFEEDFNEDGDTEDQIQIAEKKAGDYQIRVIPELGAAPDATYSLDVATLEDNFGYAPIILALDVLVSEIPIEPYSFQAEERLVTGISYTGDVSGQYSDSVNLSAVLTDANGSPIAGKDLVFSIGEQLVSAKTDSSGFARASLNLNQIPGQYYSVETSFAGDADYLPTDTNNDFEIIKEDVAVNVPEKDGFVFDEILIEAEIKDGDRQNLIIASYVEFKIGNRLLGTSTVDALGWAVSNWPVDIIPKETTENYPIEVVFSGNDYYQPTQIQADFTLKSAKWLKQGALAKLNSLIFSDKKLNSEIQNAKRLIQDSLTDSLWLDASRLIFSGKGSEVFSHENSAAKILQKRISGKQSAPLEIKNAFIAVMDKMAKADELLAKLILKEAKEIRVENPKLKKKYDQQINKAEDQFVTAKLDLSQNESAKAIDEFGKTWLYAQMAIKLGTNIP